MKDRPVVIIMSILAGIDAALGLGTLGGLIPAAALAWLLIASVAVKASIQFWVQGVVTPLAKPRNNEGKPLTANNAPSTAPLVDL